MTNPAPLKALIVDDSALNRTTLRRVLESSPEIEVVAVVESGGDALRVVREQEIDVITLDLEMPGMDGFSFLRLLMSTKPTPVVVVSSHSKPENVFKAVELGAFEFVAKPESEADLQKLEKALIPKVLVARDLKRNRLSLHPPPTRIPESDRPGPDAPEAKYLLAIAASTGGPTAVGEVLAKLSAKRPAAALVAQHMPDKFTKAFAERLDRHTALSVKEAQDGDVVRAGCAYVCPGRRSMVVERRDGQTVVRLLEPDEEETYVPSADRLFTSVADVAGSHAVGLVLTGMGTDGTAGAAAIASAGGVVVAESEDTAIVAGMPSSVVRAGHSQHVLPLDKIGPFVSGLFLTE